VLLVLHPGDQRAAGWPRTSVRAEAGDLLARRGSGR